MVPAVQWPLAGMVQAAGGAHLSDQYCTVQLYWFVLPLPLPAAAMAHTQLSSGAKSEYMWSSQQLYSDIFLHYKWKEVDLARIIKIYLEKIPCV